MSRIRGKDTSIEISLRKALWRTGLRYRVHYRRLPGSPDVAFPKARVAVFCDSSFWHGRNWPELRERLFTRREYWIARIEKNMARDRAVDVTLREMGWSVLRFWDVDITSDLDGCIRRVL